MLQSKRCLGSVLSLGGYIKKGSVYVRSDYESHLYKVSLSSRSAFKNSVDDDLASVKGVCSIEGASI